jgi:peptidoglycan/xylan/chitin deacetylase (PgdA/CDA1 family)
MSGIAVGMARAGGNALLRLRTRVRRNGDREPITIVMYHAVTAEALKVPDWCFIDLKSFEQQIRYLTTHFRVMHLEDAFAERAPAPGAKPIVCITFDDGFANNASVAFPVLQQFGAPATIFLVTDLVDSDATVWFARLHQAITSTARRDIEFCGVRLDLTDAAARQAASSQLQAMLKEMPVAQLEAGLRSIEVALGADPDSGIEATSPYRMLDSASIQSMQRSGLVRFGGHTCRHTIMSRLAPDEMIGDVARCKAEIERIVDAPCRTFAYPNGRAVDFNDDAQNALRSAGVALAVTTIAGPNFTSTNPLRLRRYGVGSGDSLLTMARTVHHLNWSLQAGTGSGLE